MATATPVMIIDLQGQCFEITQEFIDKYPNSVLAKSLMVRNGTECFEPIKIDRSGKYFSRILEHAKGRKNAFKFGQMSHGDIRTLIDDLEFFDLDEELLRRCGRELNNVCQGSIEVAPSGKHLKKMLAGETRLVIILDADYLAPDGVQSILMRSLKQVDRDSCLVIGCRGDLEGYEKELDKAPYDSFLCDPVTWTMLQAQRYTQESDLKQMIYRANTRPSHMLCRQLYYTNPTDVQRDVQAFKNRLYVRSCKV